MVSTLFHGPNGTVHNGWKDVGSHIGKKPWAITGRYVERGMTVFFVLEITMRVLAEKGNFLGGTRQDVVWNVFDSLLVIQSVCLWALKDFWFVEVCKLMLCVRLGRLLRFFKILRRVP